MGVFRKEVPKAALANIELPKGERAVAAGHCNAGFVVATQNALYLQAVEPKRIPWSTITRATWDEPELRMVLNPKAGGTSDLIVLRFDDTGELPTTIRERVTATIVMQERILLDGDRGAMFIARRGSDDGEIVWNVVFDSGLDPTHPVLRQRAEESLEQLRSQLGI